MMTQKYHPLSLQKKVPRTKITQFKQVNAEVFITKLSKKYKNFKIEKLWKVYNRVNRKEGFINAIQRVLINNDKLGYDTIKELIKEL